MEAGEFGDYAMSERFMIEISSEEAQKYRRIAKFTGQSVETVISRRLQFTPPTDSLDTQLEQVRNYSDEQLWAIVETPVLSDEETAAWDILVQRAKQGKALEGDEEASDTFSLLYNKRGLLRSKALAELLGRGYDIPTYLKENAPK
jgi:hypothetical protein